MPSFQMLLLDLIQETIDLGVPARSAAKWWLYIFGKVPQGGYIVVQSREFLYLCQKRGRN